MDMVSRKAVIEVFGDVHPLDHNVNVYIERIKELPSPIDALTDRPCAVCKHRSENGCTEWKCIFDGA